MNLLFQAGLSNACFAFALAIVATVVGARARRPHLAHMLWLLVFVKLVTPPIVMIPISISSAQAEHTIAAGDNREFDAGQRPTIAETSTVSPLLSAIAATANHARPWLASLWLLGGAAVTVWSLVRVCRFSRLLATESDVAPEELRTAAEETARRLGLHTIPKICTTSARLSPMVWWTGGEVRVVLPATLLDQMDTEQSQWILAHELAHVRRRDYLVRWLEWLACVCFWWNPVVWWAQRNLRAMEEICCDDLVLSSLNPEPKLYANSLLAAAEFLAGPALRAPAMASEINSGGYLQRRFEMIVSETSRKSNKRWLQTGVLLCAMVVLPLGIVSAQDYEAIEKRLGEAVSHGELSLEQAGVMMDALRKATGVKKDQGLDRAKAYLMKVKKVLGEAIEAGRISEEDAARRYEAAERAIKEKLASGRRQQGERNISREGYAWAEAELDKAVAAGRVSLEDARARLKAMREAMARQGEQREGRITRETYAGIERRIKAALEAGKMTREEANAKYKEIRERLARKSEGTAMGIGPEDWENIKRRIEGAVRAGRITREQADAKYKEIKERASREE